MLNYTNIWPFWRLYRTSIFMQVLFNKRVESGESHNKDQLLKSLFLSSYEWIFTSKSGIMSYFPSCTHSFSHFLVLKLFLLHNYFYLIYYCFITINNWHPNGKIIFIKILFRFFFQNFRWIFTPIFPLSLFIPRLPF